MTPVLVSGASVNANCGKLAYDSETLSLPNYYQATTGDDYQTPVEIKIETDDESIVIDYKANDFERDWKGAKLLAKFNNHLYKDIVFESPYYLSHKVSDYCLGWTMSAPNITIVNEDSVKNHDMYGLVIDRFILAHKTQFDFHKLTYTQLDKDKVDVGCGNLEYIPHFWTNKLDPRSELVWKQKDYEQEEKWRFHLKSDSMDLVGVHNFVIEVHSDIMKMEPHFYFTVRIEILPCFVRDTDLHA